jgi:hypothetical protein
MANSNFIVHNGLSVGPLTITATSGNIDTSGSIIAASFVGSGAALTGLPSGYTNSDVASYLASPHTGNILTAGTVTAASFIGSGAALTGLPAGYTNSDVASYLATASGSIGVVTTANTAMKGYADAITTAWTANAITQLGQITTVTNSVTGANVAIATANTAMKGYVDGQITTLVGGAPALLDTLSEIATAIGNDANLSVTLTNTIASKANIASPTFTGTLIAGNITSGNITLGVGSVITSGSTQPISISGMATTAATVVSPTQANITSVGTLTSLTVSGNVTATTFVGNTTGIHTGNTTGIHTGNVTGGGSIAAGNVTTSGTLNVGGLITANTNLDVYQTLSLYGNLISGGGGKTASLGVTTLVSATVTGATTLANVTAGNITLGVGSVITSGSLQPISISGSAATVTQMSQTNITSVGTLTGLTVSGTTTVGNLTSGNITLGVGSVITSGSTQPFSITGSAATATGSAATFTSTTQNSQFNSIGAGTAASATAGEIRATNNITAYYSDRRLKDVVGTIENALAAVNTLSGVRYRANELAGTFGYNTERLEVGVLAQEIQAVLPEIVVPAPFDIAQAEDGTEYSKSGENYLTVHYERIVPLLIEAIKELSAKVAALEAK